MLLPEHALTPGHDHGPEPKKPESVHVLVTALPARVNLPNMEVPVSSVVTVSSAVGQLMIEPPSDASKRNVTLEEVNEILVLAGVIAACPGVAATAHSANVAQTSNRPLTGLPMRDLLG